jgi:hypothetical protein
VTALLASALVLPSIGGANNPDDPNAATKRGAAGGALVGLTMGALAGDASLAAKGAAMGAVAGGVSGSMVDLENSRDNARTDTMADAVAGINTGGGAPVAAEPARPQTWDRLNQMVGTFRADIWGLDEEGNRVSATARVTGSLQTTSSVRLNIDEFDAAGIDGTDEITGSSTLSYDPDGGYEMLNDVSTLVANARWVGERLTGEERYSFFYAGSSGNEVLVDRRIELRFIGQDVFILETRVPDGSGEKTVQQFRFTRQ